MTTEAFDDERSALATVEALMRRRLQKKRGYQIVSSME